jgi:lipoprotein-anchoring transpeptidase ErfK/SrfK
LFGAPVTELLIENDLVVQYFERARLEAHVGVDDENPPIMLGHVGAEYASALWLTFEPAPQQKSLDRSHLFQSTRHTLQEPFLGFWQKNNGLLMLGYPISELRWEFVDKQRVQVQYFERGRMELHTHASNPLGEVRVSNLGEALALLRGYDTAPIGPVALQRTAETSSEAAAETETTAVLSETVQVSSTAAEVPQGATSPQETFFSNSPAAEEADWEVAAEASAHSSKRIVVSLSQQRIVAYEHDVQVFDAPISTGMDGFETPEGDFFIYARNPLQTMSGDLGGEYRVPNVPNSMYIVDDVAIHGTYWHNQFGTGVRRSHGCINLPLDAAAWLYNWSSVGIPVRVTSEAAPCRGT